MAGLLLAPSRGSRLYVENRAKLRKELDSTPTPIIQDELDSYDQVDIRFSIGLLHMLQRMVRSSCTGYFEKASIGREVLSRR